MPISRKLTKKTFKPVVGDFDTKPLNTKNKTPTPDRKYENVLSLRLSRIYPTRIKRYVALSNISNGNVGANFAAYTKWSIGKISFRFSTCPFAI